MMPGSTKNTVLLVDNSEIDRDILTRILGRDYEVAEVEDGETALEMMQDIRPDLILFDIMMPGMHGYEGWLQQTTGRLR